MECFYRGLKSSETGDVIPKSRFLMHVSQITFLNFSVCNFTKLFSLPFNVFDVYLSALWGSVPLSPLWPEPVGHLLLFLDNNKTFPGRYHHHQNLGHSDFLRQNCNLHPNHHNGQNQHGHESDIPNLTR